MNPLNPMSINSLLTSNTSTPQAPPANQPTFAHWNGVPPVEGSLHFQGGRWGTILKDQFVAFSPASGNQFHQIQQGQPQIQAGMPIATYITPDPNDPQKTQARAVVGGAHLLLNTREFEQQPFMQAFGHSFRNFIAHYQRSHTPQGENSQSVQPQAIGLVPLPGMLPTEMWLQIAKELPVSDKKSLRQTSRNMAPIAASSVEAVRIRNANDLEALRTFPGAKRISLSGSAITAADLHAVIRHVQTGSSLTELDLHDCGQITDAELQLIVQTLPNLTHLSLRGCHRITAAGLQPLQHAQQNNYLPNLTHLNLGNCSRIGRNATPYIGQLTNLTHLDLSGCFRINADCMEHIANLTRLTQLDLASCTLINDASLRWVANLTGLTHLNLERCFLITDAGMQHLVNMTGLTSLNMRSCFNITDASLRHLGNLTGLTSLNLSECRKITSAGVRHLAPLTSLTHLNLDSCHKITNTGIKNLWPLTNLTHLHVGYCDLGDPVFRHFAPQPDPDNPDQSVQPFANLIHLDFAKCNKITKTENLSRLTKLESLNFSSCSKLKDLEGLRGLGHLKSLKLSGCEAIGSASADLGPLLDLPDLTSLDVSCSDLSPLQLQMIGRMTNLRTLELRLQDMSNGNLHALGSLTNLIDLNIAFATLSNADLPALHALSNLRKLNMSTTQIAPNNARHMGLQFLPHLTKLTTLNLGDSPHVSDADLVHLPQLHNLKNLNLTSCFAVTDTFLHWYSMQPNSLTSLSLYNCVNITDHAVPALQRMHALSNLDITNTPLSNNAIRNLGTVIANVKTS